MDSINVFIATFAHDDSGVTSIEYALLGALISMFIVTGVGLMADQIAALFNRVANDVTAALNG